jgi:hypothetical protein
MKNNTTEQKPMKGARKIVVNGASYWWLYRGSRVVIWDVDGKKHVYYDSEVTGWSNDAIERGVWKSYFSITPKQIEIWIKRESI